MKNFILKIPAETKIKQLPIPILQVIEAVNGRWRWIGREVNGYRLIDGISSDSFGPHLLPPGWELLAARYWNGQPITHIYDTTDPTDIKIVGCNNKAITIIPRPTEMIDYLDDIITFDLEGNEVSRERPTELIEQHSWSGWPAWE